MKEITDMKCPYCGSAVVLKDASEIYHSSSADRKLYVCAKYPECDTYSRADPVTLKPLSTLADKKLRALRKETHDLFNQIYEKKIMSKKDAYRWLGQIIQAPGNQAHIGKLNEYYCMEVQKKSRQLLEAWENTHAESKTKTKKQSKERCGEETCGKSR